MNNEMPILAYWMSWATKEQKLKPFSRASIPGLEPDRPERGGVKTARTKFSKS